MTDFRDDAAEVLADGIRSVSVAYTLVPLATGVASADSLYVFVEFDVEMLDEHQTIADRQTVATFIKSELPGTLKQGDIIRNDTYSYTIQRTYFDDGYFVKAALI